ncbi:MAG: hypothetical protein QM703_09890 [Gemmatales bacterium]
MSDIAIVNPINRSVRFEDALAVEAKQQLQQTPIVYRICTFIVTKVVQRIENNLQFNIHRSLYVPLHVNLQSTQVSIDECWLIDKFGKEHIIQLSGTQVKAREGNHLTIVSISDGLDGKKQSQFMMLNHETEVHDTFVEPKAYLKSRLGLVPATGKLSVTALVAFVASFFVGLAIGLWLQSILAGAGIFFVGCVIAAISVMQSESEVRTFNKKYRATVEELSALFAVAVGRVATNAHKFVWKS